MTHAEVALHVLLRLFWIPSVGQVENQQTADVLNLFVTLVWSVRSGTELKTCVLQVKPHFWRAELMGSPGCNHKTPFRWISPSEKQGGLESRSKCLWPAEWQVCARVLNPLCFHYFSLDRALFSSSTTVFVYLTSWLPFILWAQLNRLSVNGISGIHWPRCKGSLAWLNEPITSDLIFIHFRKYILYIVWKKRPIILYLIILVTEPKPGGS